MLFVEHCFTLRNFSGKEIFGRLLSVAMRLENWSTSRLWTHFHALPVSNLLFWTPTACWERNLQKSFGKLHCCLKNNRSSSLVNASNDKIYLVEMIASSPTKSITWNVMKFGEGWFHWVGGHVESEVCIASKNEASLHLLGKCTY